MKESDYLDENAPVVQRLKELPIFRSFDEEDIRGILPFSKMREYEEGETIIREGDNTDKHIYFLLSGKVAVMRDGVELYRVGHSGEIFGEMAMLEHKARSASVNALHQTLCLAVNSSYTEMLEKQEKVKFMYILYRVIAETLSERLRVANEKFVEAKKNPTL